MRCGVSDPKLKTVCQKNVVIRRYLGEEGDSFLETCGKKFAFQSYVREYQIKAA